MYAIIETGGKQYRVEPGDVVDIEQLPIGPGETVEFEHVLAVSDGETVTVGAPQVEGATVSGELVEQRRGDKVLVFKMKRRKGYRRRQGHRQELSRVRIVDIKLPGAEA